MLTSYMQNDCDAIKEKKTFFKRIYPGLHHSGIWQYHNQSVQLFKHRRINIIKSIVINII